ncbi:MAG: hypothetical protein K2X87_24725 [Gemmataceae bacterium]|nr:hypothetical protein [Gemmataceae bacterium]
MPFAGEWVVVDASFGAERHRQAFLGVTARLAVATIFLRCEAAQVVAAARLAAQPIEAPVGSGVWDREAPGVEFKRPGTRSPCRRPNVRPTTKRVFERTTENLMTRGRRVA